MPLKVTITNRDAGTKHVLLDGKLDAVTSPQFEDEITSSLSPGVRVLILDLADLSYISSAGIGAIFKARKLMEERTGSLLLVNLRPSVQKVFDIVKALPVQPIFASVQELDQYLDAMQRKVRNDSGER